MDLSQIIKTISIAKWLRYVSLLFVVTYLGFAFYIAYLGLFLAKAEIVQSGSSLISAGLPVFLVVLFISFYDSGSAPLEKSTRYLL